MAMIYVLVSAAQEWLIEKASSLYQSCNSCCKKLLQTLYFYYYRGHYATFGLVSRPQREQMPPQLILKLPGKQKRRLRRGGWQRSGLMAPWSHHRLLLSGRLDSRQKWP